jgi:CubicO group peptidase (beta-lactamase class C family)
VRAAPGAPAAAPTSGRCDARFDAVRDAFRANFAERGEVGAAVAVYVGDALVVDLWGGFANAARNRPWAADTLVDVFSVGKGLVALCAAMLVDRGRLDLDAPARRIWPELSGGERDAITPRLVLAHRAGLPAIRDTMPEDAMLDWGAMTAALAREVPWWPPGSAHGYHVNTFGYLVGEMIRRVAGCTVGELLRREVAARLHADVHIGLPRSEHGRVAEYLWPQAPLPARPSEDDLEATMKWCTYWNPAGLSGRGWVNTAAWRSAEVPSANAHATARGVARVYAALANGGTLAGAALLSPATLDEAAREHSNGPDRVLDRPSRFGLGFQLTQPERPLGPGQKAFGHFGAGGSLGFCDPDARLGFAYVMNDMGPRFQNPRNRALIDAVYSCL